MTEVLLTPRGGSITALIYPTLLSVTTSIAPLHLFIGHCTHYSQQLWSTSPLSTLSCSTLPSLHNPSLHISGPSAPPSSHSEDIGTIEVIYYIIIIIIISVYSQLLSFSHVFIPISLIHLPSIFWFSFQIIQTLFYSVRCNFISPHVFLCVFRTGYISV